MGQISNRKYLHFANHHCFQYPTPARPASHGPETFTFNELARLLARTVGSRSHIIHVPPSLGYLFANLLGLLVRDVLLTRDEIDGLLANLLVTESPATGDTRLSEWLKENADKVGVRYASELKRHYRIGCCRYS
jgi:NADH dehydrogenase